MKHLASRATQQLGALLQEEQRSEGEQHRREGYHSFPDLEA
jgi:hypothetical protein